MEALEILTKLIVTPSFSGEEDGTAKILEKELVDNGIYCQRIHNNVWAKNLNYDPSKPSILLNSHHDTVKPNKGYTLDPFVPKISEGKLFGLGSNDAGGCLVALLETFKFFYAEKNLKYNLIFAATAEEENSGEKGIRSLLPTLPDISFAIVGEPTNLKLAVAEKGLMVIDACSNGIAGHVAHTNTVNPIEIAMNDIQSLKELILDRVSDLLGPVKITCTQITAGTAHNVVPSTCNFVIDVRVNECYSNQELFEIIDQATESKLKARSFRLNSSGISLDHPIVTGAENLGIETYGSPTLSDQANLTCPSVKIGPGSSLRSHKADEFIYVDEIEEGIKTYTELLKEILK
ncbi:MAG: M20 family metallo-hydrolase [Crocinitomicaceae bacterium]|nr:M20 family metallo-hydrolase [Crocinitomicaceae bacterium]